MEPRLTARLTLKAYERLVPVATGFVEKSALTFGLGQKEALALATEEVFLYLAHISSPGAEVDIRCRSGGYCVKTDLVFEAAGFHVSAFNLTATPSFENEASIRETGLLIASRLVDRFDLAGMENRLVLKLVKEKTYPDGDDQDVPASVPLSRFLIRLPDSEEVLAAVQMASYYCRDAIRPPSTEFPGKVAEMFAVGEIDAALAVDDAGHMGGIIFWTRNAARVVECYGPYVFHPESDPEMARHLVDRLLEEIARSGAVGLINRYPGTGLPSGYFETLGSLRLCHADGTCVDVEASYRQLREDSGIAVWAHPDLVPFLNDQYERFTLPRVIHRLTERGEIRDPFGVLFVEVDRPRHWAILRSMIYGEDAPTLLDAHFRLLEKDGFRAVFFEMDLKDPGQGHFTPGLLKNGFEPRILLPHGGKGDLVIFQHRTHGKA
jgi:hypothetical protein